MDEVFLASSMRLPGDYWIGSAAGLILSAAR